MPQRLIIGVIAGAILITERPLAAIACECPLGALQSAPPPGGYAPITPKIAVVVRRTVSTFALWHGLPGVEAVPATTEMIPYDGATVAYIRPIQPLIPGETYEVTAERANGSRTVVTSFTVAADQYEPTSPVDWAPTALNRIPMPSGCGAPGYPSIVRVEFTNGIATQPPVGGFMRIDIDGVFDQLVPAFPPYIDIGRSGCSLSRVDPLSGRVIHLRATPVDAAGVEGTPREYTLTMPPISGASAH